MRAVVFNKYMKGLGGGERSTFAYASALRLLGYEVEVISTNGLPERSRVEETFGVEFADIPMRALSQSAFVQEMSEHPPEVFVNHSFLDFTSNPAALGIYSQMFPTRRIDIGNASKEVNALKSYQMILNNSSFTKSYTDLLWDYPKERSYLLHPPVGRNTIEAAESLLLEPPIKEKTIVGIGRFNVYPANKNQKLIIEGFLEAKSKYAALEGWKLLLVGNRNPDPESEAYYGECVELVEHAGGSVELRSELSNEELATSLRDAFGYVHATGAFIPPGKDPFRCEHLGLSIVEAMANGCIPLVYARGGIYDILDVGQAGIPYATYEGLVEGFQEMACMWHAEDIARTQKALAEMSLRMSFEHFAEKLGEFIRVANEHHAALRGS